MYFFKYNRKCFSNMLLAFSILFLLHVAITPPVFHESVDIKEYITTGKMLYEYPQANRKVSFIASDYSDNDFLIDMVMSHILNSNIQNSRQLFTLVIDMLSLLLTGWGVLDLYRKSLIKEKDQHMPLLAISKGGHAPPLGLYP